MSRVGCAARGPQATGRGDGGNARRGTGEVLQQPLGLGSSLPREVRFYENADVVPQSYSVCFSLWERLAGPNTITNATAQIISSASMVEVTSPPAPPEAAQKL